MSTIRVDTVSEYTSANGVAIDSVTLKDGAVYPSSADGGALGAAANEWSDIYIADSGVVYFGNDQEIKITHIADTGLNLKHTATADDKPIVLTLQTGETDLAANDVIGKLAFQAPDEGTGTDAVLVSAAIQARAEGDHSSSSNATSIDFMTGASEAATKKLSITSAGHFIPGADNTYDVGTSSLEFKDGYFDGTLYCDTLNLAGTDHTAISGGLFASYAVIEDQKSLGTDGGTFNSGSWAVRNLNTEITDPDGIVSIASNQFTLAAGSYLIKWYATAFKVSGHQTVLYDITGSADLEFGSTDQATTAAVTNKSIGATRHVPGGSNVYEIRHRCTGDQSTNGFGKAHDLAVESYCLVEIYKES